jgi:hypothetical protein
MSAKKVRANHPEAYPKGVPNPDLLNLRFFQVKKERIFEIPSAPPEPTKEEQRFANLNHIFKNSREIIEFGYFKMEEDSDFWHAKHLTGELLTAISSDNSRYERISKTYTEMFGSYEENDFMNLVFKFFRIQPTTPQQWILLYWTTVFESLLCALPFFLDLSFINPIHFHLIVASMEMAITGKPVHLLLHTIFGSIACRSPAISLILHLLWDTVLCTNSPKDMFLFLFKHGRILLLAWLEHHFAEISGYPVFAFWCYAFIESLVNHDPILTFTGHTLFGVLQVYSPSVSLCVHVLANIWLQQANLRGYSVVEHLLDADLGKRPIQRIGYILLSVASAVSWWYADVQPVVVLCLVLVSLVWKSFYFSITLAGTMTLAYGVAHVVWGDRQSLHWSGLTCGTLTRLVLIMMQFCSDLSISSFLFALPISLSINVNAANSSLLALDFILPVIVCCLNTGNESCLSQLPPATFIDGFENLTPDEQKAFSSSVCRLATQTFELDQGEVTKIDCEPHIVINALVNKNNVSSSFVQNFDVSADDHHVHVSLRNRHESDDGATIYYDVTYAIAKTGKTIIQTERVDLSKLLRCFVASSTKNPSSIDINLNKLYSDRNAHSPIGSHFDSVVMEVIQYVIRPPGNGFGELVSSSVDIALQKTNVLNSTCLVLVFAFVCVLLTLTHAYTAKAEYNALPSLVQQGAIIQHQLETCQTNLTTWWKTRHFLHHDTLSGLINHWTNPPFECSYFKSLTNFHAIWFSNIHAEYYDVFYYFGLAPSPAKVLNLTLPASGLIQETQVSFLMTVMMSLLFPTLLLNVATYSTQHSLVLISIVLPIALLPQFIDMGLGCPPATKACRISSKITALFSFAATSLLLTSGATLLGAHSRRTRTNLSVICNNSRKQLNNSTSTESQMTSNVAPPTLSSSGNPTANTSILDQSTPTATTSKPSSASSSESSTNNSSQPNPDQTESLGLSKQSQSVNDPPKSTNSSETSKLEQQILAPSNVITEVFLLKLSWTLFFSFYLPFPRLEKSFSNDSSSAKTTPSLKQFLLKWIRLLCLEHLGQVVPTASSTCSLSLFLQLDQSVKLSKMEEKSRDASMLESWSKLEAACEDGSKVTTASLLVALINTTLEGLASSSKKSDFPRALVHHFAESSFLPLLLQELDQVSSLTQPKLFATFSSFPYDLFPMAKISFFRISVAKRCRIIISTLIARSLDQWLTGFSTTLDPVSIAMPWLKLKTSASKSSSKKFMPRWMTISNAIESHFTAFLPTSAKSLESPPMDSIATLPQSNWSSSVNMKSGPMNENTEFQLTQTSINTLFIHCAMVVVPKNHQRYDTKSVADLVMLSLPTNCIHVSQLDSSAATGKKVDGSPQSTGAPTSANAVNAAPTSQQKNSTPVPSVESGKNSKNASSLNNSVSSPDQPVNDDDQQQLTSSVSA